jgi:ribosomal protein S2
MPEHTITPAGYLLWVATPASRWWAGSPSNPNRRAQIAANAEATDDELHPAHIAPIIAWADLDTDPIPVTPDGPIPLNGMEQGATWFIDPDRAEAVRQARQFAEQERAAAAEACQRHEIPPLSGADTK